MPRRLSTERRKFLNLTCAPEGKLAVESADDPNALTLLIPRANDKGFAMTGSMPASDPRFSTLILRHRLPRARRPLWAEHGRQDGRGASSAREAEIAELPGWRLQPRDLLGFRLLWWPCPGELSLKILELAHGPVATSCDYLHGLSPLARSPCDDKTLVFVVSSATTPTPVSTTSGHPQRDRRRSRIAAKHAIAVQQDGATKSTTARPSLPSPATKRCPRATLALPFVMFAQAISLLNSVRVGNTPDTPSPTGTVNRVVKGVTIHPFTA
ncbi:MAG: hypothetical protein ACLU7D_02415 [Collinsella sp.]